MLPNDLIGLGIAIYARFSTDRHRNASAEDQARRCKEFVRGARRSYPFSGLPFCGVCGAPMVISGGSSKQYYRCADRVKRGTCTNSLSVPEDVTRASLLEELRHRLASPAGIAYARKRFAERLGELERTRKADTTGHRRHLDVLERQIALDFIAEGGASSAVAQRLKGLEAEADGERRKLAVMKQLAAAPIALPTPERMVRTVFDLEQRLRTDVVKARTELARLFRRGQILLMPQPGGFYIAKNEILPLALLTLTPPQGTLGRRDTDFSCAGAIGALNTRVSLGFERRLAA